MMRALLRFALLVVGCLLAGGGMAFGQTSDISVSKTDGVASAVPGSSTVYTIVVSNLGPDDANFVFVTDNFPAEVSSASWTCAGAGGGTCGAAAGAGDINELVDLPNGSSVTYTATVNIDPAATGNLVNTASGTPFFVTDPVAANNSATDTDTLTPQANLGITKTDGSATAVPGNPISYTIVASNPVGPSDAPSSNVVDAFPADLTGVTWTCAGAGGGSCAAAGAGDINELVDIPVGGTVTFTVNATVDPAATGTLTNTATVSTSGSVTETAPGNNTNSDIDSLTPQSDLGITKTDGQATAIPGNPTSYTITVTNASGPSDAPSSTVTDNFPAALTGVTWTCVGAGGGSCAAAGAGNISESVDLPVGGSVTFTVNATIDPSALGVLSNTASVAEPVGHTDPNGANDSATDNTTLTPRADLEISKVESSDPVVAGDTMDYDVTVTNHGPSDALAVTFVDTLPNEAVFVSAAGCTHDGSPTGGDVTCILGTVAAGAAPVTTIEVMILSSVVDGTVITNNATVSSSTTDPGPNPNSVMIDTTVEREPDLGVSKVASTDPVIAGTSFDYTITVDNNGLSDASLVELTDTLPGEVSFVSATGSCTHDGSPFGGVITCPIGDLVAFDSVFFTVTTTVEPCTPIGTIMTNTAVVTNNPVETDPGPTPNTFDLDTTVDTLADVSLTKTGSPAIVTAGENMTYTVTISNAGPSCAADVSVLDTFPADVLFLEGMSDASCVDGATTATCPQGTMTVGQVITLTLVGKVACAAADTSTQTNTATVSSSTADPNGVNNTDTYASTVTTLADLRVVKDATPDPVQPGSNLRYNIDVFNDGPSDALGVVVADVLPSGLVFASASTECSESGGTVTCNLGSLACGKWDQVRIQARVETDESITNTATASTTTTESSTSNNSDSVTTSIRAGQGVQMRLSASPRTLREGGITTAIYLIRVRNKALVAKDNIVVTNTLPTGVSFTAAQPAPTSVVDNVVTFDLGTMASFESQALIIEAELIEDTAPETPLVNTAVLTEDAVTIDSQSFAGRVRDPGPSGAGDLRVQLTSVRRVIAGAKFTSTIDVINTSRKEAEDVQVTLALPNSLELEFTLPEPASTVTVGDETTLTWDFPSLRGPSTTRIKVVERIAVDAEPGSTFEMNAEATDADLRTATDAHLVEIKD